MAETYWPFENVDTTETQFSQWSRNTGEGVKGLPSTTDLKPYGDGSGMTVKVPAGQAQVRGHYYNNDATITLTISAADSTNPRIDSVVLTLDPTANTITAGVVTGTPAASPVAPTLTQTDAGTYQLQLATVLVGAAVSNITATVVTDTRPFLGYVYNVPQNAPRGNAVINGAFDFWQRGTSLAQTGYLADRFRFATTGGNAGKVLTQSQQTVTPGIASTFGYEAQYTYRLAVTTTGASYTYEAVEQPIEDVRTLAGQTVTFSFWAKATTGSFTVTPRFDQYFGSGGSSTVTTNGTAITLTTSWKRYFQTFTLPSVASKTIGTSSALIAILQLPNNTLYSLDLWGVQVEAGSVASPFRRAGSTLAGELMACHRYYVRHYPGASNAIGNGQVTSTTTAVCTYKLPVPMRITPTAVETSINASYYAVSTSAGSSTALTSVPSFNGLSNNEIAYLTCTVASGLTAGNATIMSATNAGGYLGFSAEF